MNFQMFKLVLEKAEEPEIKLPTTSGSSKKQESSRKTSISALLAMPKPLTVWITIKEMGIPDHLTCLLRNLYAGQEATVKQQEGQAPTERGRETLIQGRVTSCPTLPARDEHAATLPPGCPRSLVRRNVSRRRPGPAGHLPSGP